MILSEATKEALDELNAWAVSGRRDDPKRLKFLKLLAEYFDPTSLTLIVRAIDKSKLLTDKRK